MLPIGNSAAKNSWSVISFAEYVSEGRPYRNYHFQLTRLESHNIFSVKSAVAFKTGNLARTQRLQAARSPETECHVRSAVQSAANESRRLIASVAPLALKDDETVRASRLQLDAGIGGGRTIRKPSNPEPIDDALPP
jgi:hypothetical protein